MIVVTKNSILVADVLNETQSLQMARIFVISERDRARARRK